MRFASGSQSRGVRRTPGALRLGLAALVSGGSYVAGISFAPVAAPLLLVVPLPGLIVAVENPRACSWWLLLTAGAVGLACGTGAAVSWLLLFGLPVSSLAIGFRHRCSFEATALAGMAGWAAGLALSTFLAYGDLTTLVTTAREQLVHGVDVAFSTYGAVGVSESHIAAVKADRDTVVTGLLEILPALVVLSGALMVIANLVLLRRWTNFSRDVDLRLWRTPDVLIWALVAAGFAMFLPVYPAALAARNVFIVLLGCYFCQGLAIVSYFWERLRLPYGVRVAGYLLIAVQHVVAGIVLALGVFDLWGDFRRLSAGAADMQIPSDGK